MIKINKTSEPNILRQNGHTWTQELITAIGSRTYSDLDNATKKRFRSYYRRKAIKTAIAEEANRKCSYCESKFLGTSFGEIDHVIPISRQPQLAYIWNNLVHSCKKCNNAKLHYHDPSDPIAHPVDDDPVQHISFEPTTAIAIPRAAGASIGLTTIREVALNRQHLLEDRIRHLDTLIELAKLLQANDYYKSKEGAVSLKALWNRAHSTEVFSTLTREFLRATNLPEPLT
jgi:uncharacterized protein (TIGR02646 family)